MHRADARRLQGFQHQHQHFQIAFVATVTIQFHPGLIRTARTAKAVGAGTQHRAHITQPDRTGTLEPVSIDPGHLWRHIGPHPHHPPAQLIGQFEGLQLQIVAGAGQQRLQKLDQRGGNQFVTPAFVQIEQLAAQPLHPASGGWQDFFDTFRQKPAIFSGHGGRKVVRFGKTGGGWIGRIQRNTYSTNNPSNMLANPTKRSARSSSFAICNNVWRKRLGLRNGKIPSSTSIKPKAASSSFHMAAFAGGRDTVVDPAIAFGHCNLLKYWKN